MAPSNPPVFTSQGDFVLLIRGLIDTVRGTRDRRRLSSMADAIEGGTPIQEAVGQQTGIARGLAEVALQLASSPQSAFKLLDVRREHHVARQKLISSLIYPLTLCGFAIVAFVVFSWQTTRARAFIDQSHVAEAFTTAFRAKPYQRKGDSGLLFSLIPAVSVSCVGMLAMVHLLGGRASVARVYSILPLVGPWLRGQSGADLLRMTGLLLDQGVHLDRALSMAAHASDHAINRIVGLQLSNRIQSGIPLSRAMQQTTWFPRWVSASIAEGACGALLGQQLQNLARLLDGDAFIAARVMSRMIPTILFLITAVLLQIAFFEYFERVMEFLLPYVYWLRIF